jgi:hypothetical protein
MLLKLLFNKRLLGRRIVKFRGCGACPLSDHACQHDLAVARLSLRHTGSERWDNWGHIVQVFERGEIVEVELRYDSRYIYCAAAESTRFPGVNDFVNLENFSEAEP